MRPPKSKSWFTRFAKWTARVSGRPVTFMIAVVVILAWVITGPIFGFSDTWQLVINTGTTIVNFLMVFLNQNTQDRASETVQIKMDEMICDLKGAHNALHDLEELEDEELDRMRGYYERIAERARTHLRAGTRDAGSPEAPEEEEAISRETG